MRLEKHHLTLVLMPERTIMRTTVTLDDDLVSRAQELTGVKERSVLLREGLETLIRVESARRLAALGGAEPEAQASARNRDLGDLAK